METTAGVSSEHWWGWDHGVALVLAAHTVTWPLSMQVVAPELRQQPDSGRSSPTPPPFRSGAGWHMPGRTQENHLCFPSEENVHQHVDFLGCPRKSASARVHRRGGNSRQCPATLEPQLGLQLSWARGQFPTRAPHTNQQWEDKSWDRKADKRHESTVRRERGVWCVGC